VRVLILGLNYLPESTSIGPYTSDLAESLLAAGHSVEVVTGFPMAPQWRIWEGYRGKWFSREVVNGVPIRRCYLYVPKEPRRTVNRVLFDTSFAVSSFLAALTTGRCDLVLSVSPPLQAGLTGSLVSKLKRAPLFVHVQDLVPDAAVATGMLAEGSLAARMARGMERWVYRHAEAVGVICEGFRQNLLAKGVPARKIKLLHNHINLDFIAPGPRDGRFRAQWGIAPSDFVVMYSGSVGLKQGLETLIDTAKLLSSERQVRFVIIGEGPSLPGLVVQATAARLSNVTFLPLQPRELLPEQLAAADVLAITQRRAVTDTVFPGKLLYYMAAARPILAAVSGESETGRFITAQRVGVVTPPEDPAAMAGAILQLRQQGVEELGRRGRAVVEQVFDRRVVLPAFLTELEALAGAGRTPHSRS
jgi:colanic acid biosynthesis glycosyl transferase WcaI